MITFNATDKLRNKNKINSYKFYVTYQTVYVRLKKGNIVLFQLNPYRICIEKTEIKADEE